MRRPSSWTVLGTVAAGVAFALAAAGPANAAAQIIQVPGDFVPALSDTRSAGHYQLVGTTLRVYTDDASSNAKVAEYVATTKTLASVGEPVLNVTNVSGTVPPGFQLVTDFDNDGTPDGILVGEPTFYGNDWWLTNGSAAFVKAGAPSTSGGSGSTWHGTLAQWRTAFPNAVVRAFGFSLGSGVQGDWVITSIDFAGDNYTFGPTIPPDVPEAPRLLLIPLVAAVVLGGGFALRRRSVRTTAAG